MLLLDLRVSACITVYHKMSQMGTRSVVLFIKFVL